MNERYRIKDSLQVISVDELRLTVNEYEQYRQDDMELIESLRADKSRLQRITSTETATTYRLNGQFADGIAWRDALTKEFAEADAEYDSLYADTLKVSPLTTSGLTCMDVLTRTITSRGSSRAGIHCCMSSM